MFHDKIFTWLTANVKSTLEYDERKLTTWDLCTVAANDDGDKSAYPSCQQVA